MSTIKPSQVRRRPRPDAEHSASPVVQCAHAEKSASHHE